MTPLPRMLLLASLVSACAGGLVLTEGVAAAQATAKGATAAGLTPDQARAAEHFQRAKDLYQAGSYRDAIAELESARALDPKAKELVFNLCIVHEKLARFDEAIAWFQTYLGMEGITEAERAKAESVIKRIEGAKREVSQETPAQAATGDAPPPESAPGRERGGERPRMGRVDALTIGAASVAGVSLGVFAVFGVRALAQRPDGFVTGRDGSYDDLRAETDAAHTSAVVADVGLAVAVLATAATGILYFGRTKEPSPRRAAALPRFVAARARGGGTFGLAGTF